MAGLLALCCHVTDVEATTVYFFDEAGRLSSVQSDGGNRKTLSEQMSVPMERQLEIAPGGLKLLYLTRKGQSEEDETSITVYDVEKAQARVLYKSANWLNLIGFSPDSASVAFTDTRHIPKSPQSLLRVLVCDLSTGAVDEVPVAQSLPPPPDANATSIWQAFWSKDGKFIAALLTFETLKLTPPGMAPAQEVYRVFEYDVHDKKLLLENQREWLWTEAAWHGSQSPNAGDDRKRHAGFEASLREYLGKYSRHVNCGYQASYAGYADDRTLAGDAAVQVERLDGHCQLLLKDAGAKPSTVIMERPLTEIPMKGRLCPIVSPRWLPGDTQVIFYEGKAVWVFDRTTEGLTNIIDAGSGATWYDPAVDQRVAKKVRPASSQE